MPTSATSRRFATLPGLRHFLAVTLFALLPVGVAGPLQAATLTDSGNSLTIDLAASEQITAGSDGSTYTLVSNQTFINGGVASAGTDFTGFGTSTLTVEPAGLTRYFNFLFTDAGAGADLVFSDGGGSWQDTVLVTFDGTGSRVANSGPLTSVAPLAWEAETVELAADITGDSIEFYGPVTLTASVALDGSFNVLFDSTLDGAHSLTLTSPAVRPEGGVGVTTPLAEFSVGAGGSTNLGSAVITTGAQSYGNPVTTPAAGTFLRASDLDFSGTVSGTGPLRIAPADFNGDVSLGTAASTGGLHLSDAELALLADGFASITVGWVGGAGRITVDSAAFADTLNLHAAEIRVEGDVVIDGDLLIGGELIASATGLTPGTDHSRLRVLGSARTAALVGGALTGEDVEFPATVGDEITLVELDDGSSSVAGTFAGLAEGDSARFGPFRWTITYVGGDGNDIVLQVSETEDYGDAPDTSAGTGAGNYQTLLSDDGPRHDLGQPIYLGAIRDAEPHALASDDAFGDDQDQGSPSDEDGPALRRVELDVTTGAPHSVVLHTTNDSGAAATLSGWIDYDGDGVFDNATERAQATVPDGTLGGTTTLTFPPAPPGSAANTGFARFRISTDPAAENPTGSATDGEVEDHRVRIFEPTDGWARSTGSMTSAVNRPDNAFGAAIAEIGDVDGDGVEDLVVGSPANVTATTTLPSIEVIFLNADGTQKGSNAITTGLSGSGFGAAVAPLGDLDGDGIPDVAVGENGFDGDKGRIVLVLLQSDGTAKQMSLYRPARTGAERFGSAVANLGDLDGDGIVDLAVGSSELDLGVGGVSILFLKRDGKVRSETLLADGVGGVPALAAGIGFGSAVAAVGDLDGDGVTELAVGAPKSGAGAIYLLFLNQDGTAAAHLLHDTTDPVIGALQAGDDLGAGLAAVGDLDGDGIRDLAVGLPGRDALGRGTVFLLYLQAGGTLAGKSELGHLQGGVPDLQDRRRFGTGLGKRADLNANGVPELLIGAPVDVGSTEGQVYVLRLNALPVISETSPTAWMIDEDPTPAPTLTLNASDGDGDTLTWSIASAATSGLAEVSGTGTSQTVTYTPDPNFHGMDSFDVAVSDGTSSDVVTVEVTVDPVNDQPAITAPASIHVTEDAASPLTGISFADVDAGGNQLLATLSVASGVLTPTYGTGVVVGGTNTARTLQGTLAQLNGYFTNGHLTYTPTANSTANVTLGVVIDDLGSFGSGGNQTDSRNVTLIVDAVNDPPSISAPASLAVTEDVATAVTGISFADLDTGTSQAQATLSVPSGTLDAVSGPNVSVGGTATAMTLTGRIADLNGFLANDRVTYTTAQDATADVTLNVLIDDLGNTGSGGNLTDSQDVTLTVDPVNDPPTITAPASLAVTEDVATALSGISFADVDADGNSMRATLTVPRGSLDATSGSGVTVGGDAATMTLDGSLADLNAFLGAGGVTYTTVLDDTDDVTLGVGIDDLGHTGSGGSQTNAQDVTLTVDPVNDAPAVSAPASINVTEDSESSLHGISFADVDAGLETVRVTLTVTRGSLVASNGFGITVGGTATAMTLGGTIADLNDFFDVPRVSYTTAQDDLDDVTLGVLIDDLGHTGSGGNLTDSHDVTLTVTAVNDAPTVSAPASLTVTEDVASALSGISFADVDAGAGSVQAMLTVPRGGLNATSGSGVTVGGSSAAMALNGTLFDLNAFLAAGGVTYTTALDDVDDVLFLNVALNDQGHTGSGGPQVDSRNVALTVTAVNDAPSFSITSELSVGVDEGPQSVADFAFDLSPGPADEAGQALSFTLTDNTNPTLFSAGPALAADGTLTFTSAAGQVGDATITVELSDDGGVSNGGVDTSAEQSFDIRVVEQTPPEVVGVSASPGGALTDCAQLSAPIDAFVVEFSEAMADPAGDADPQDVTNPANYELWAAGDDHDLDTITCGLTAGDDEAILVASVAWDGGSNEATVTLAAPLADGPYRLLVCASLEDQAGNTLVEDVSRTFRQATTNEFHNGHLDCDLDGWTTVSTLPAEIDHSTEDRDDASISGSARVQQLSSSTDFSLAQCIDVNGVDRLRFSGTLRVDDGASDLTLERFCLGSPTPGCTSPGTPLDLASEAVSVTGGDWLPFTSDHSLPSDAVSALCTVNVHTASGGAFDVFLDGLRIERFVFTDGFESGDTTAWSVVVP